MPRRAPPAGLSANVDPVVVQANTELLASWLLSLHAKAPRTRLLYTEEARRFARWLAEHDLPTAAPGDLLAVGRRDAETWVGDLQAAGLSPATIRSRWIALRSLYGWCVEEEEVTASPLAKVVVAKADAGPVDTIPAADLARLFAACEGTDFTARRDLAVLRTLAATGARVSEACGIDLDDLNLAERLVRIRHAKGGRDRFARFDPKTAAALDRYRRVRARHRFGTLPSLFIGHRGALTRKGLPAILERRCTIAGLGHLHPHQLRHSFADSYLSAGGQEGDLMQLGGWTSAEVMRRYGRQRATTRALASYDAVDPLRGL